MSHASRSERQCSTPIGALGIAGMLLLSTVASTHGAPVPSTPSSVTDLPVAPISTESGPRTLRVGATQAFMTPSAAAAIAHDGDTVEISPGDYHGDVAVWKASHLRIVGLEPRPHLYADGHDAEGKAIWVMRGDEQIVENVEMSGAKVAEGNGAALRVEGRGFTLRNAWLHDNQNGLLAGANATSEITIDHCEFGHNGGGDGSTHNLYVGAVGKLTVSRSYFHHAVVGHNFKSRALISYLSDNRLADEADGRASYEADFPNGGRVTLAFNIFQKSVNAENTTLVSYGAEGLAPDGDHVFVAKGNTFISQRPTGTRFLVIAPGTQSVTIIGNVFAGPGQLPEIAGIRANNAVQREMPGNVDLRPEGFR